MNTLQSYEIQEIVEDLMAEILAIRDEKNEIEEDFDRAVDEGDKVAERAYEAALNVVHANLKAKTRELTQLIKSI
jgi:hypothetical protein